MDLIDAFVLEPPRMHIWLTAKPAGQTYLGTGTQADPYNASTQARFDNIMKNVVTENMVVHLAPGVFETAGYYETSTDVPGSLAWEMKPGVQLMMGGTTINLVNTTALEYATRFFAIGHARIGWHRHT